MLSFSYLIQFNLIQFNSIDLFIVWKHIDKSLKTILVYILRLIGHLMTEADILFTAQVWGLKRYTIVTQHIDTKK